MTITHYPSSSKGPVPIVDMNYKHLENSYNSLVKKGEGDGALALALKAEMDSRPAPEEAAGPAGSIGVVQPRTPIREEETAVFTLMGGMPSGVGHNQPPEMSVLLAETHARLLTEMETTLKEAMGLTEITNDDAVAVATELDRRLAALAKEADAAHAAEKGPLAKITTVIDQFFLTRGIKGRIVPGRTHLSKITGAYLEAKTEKERLHREALAKIARDEADAKLAEAAAAEAAGQHTLAEVKTQGALANEAVAERMEERAAAPMQEMSRTTTVAGTATAQKTVVWSVDREKLDLEALRAFFPDDAIDSAIRALVKARGWKGGQLIGPEPEKSIKGVTFSEKASARFR